MGVRGDAFDFITTSPPAVIAKVIQLQSLIYNINHSNNSFQVIFWIGEGSMQTVDILYDIDEYLNGLDNIVMDNEVGEKMCESPNYGHFVVVINKMMGDATDEQLLLELMTPEPDFIEGSKERNEIRAKLSDCFNGISAHGLPVLSIESGQEIDYPILDDRFKGGLAAMANTIIEKSLVPRIVTVGGLALELNSTTAVGIISTIIDEANEGKIDLTGFQSFWKIVTFQVENEITQSQTNLDFSLPLCSVTTQITCSDCACEFRNEVIDESLRIIDNIFEMAAKEAQQLFGEDVTDIVNEEYETIIYPWAESNQCDDIEIEKVSTDEEHCDFSTIGDVISPEDKIEFDCTYGFLCGTLSYAAKNISFHVNNLYIGKQTMIEVLPPGKASSGADGEDGAGQDGGDGEDGIHGTNIYFILEALMKASSADSLIVFTHGGDGGDGGHGGRGVQGENGIDGVNGAKGVKGQKGETGASVVEEDLESIPPELTTATGVYASSGKVQIDHHNECHTNCWCHCNVCDEWWRWRYNWTTSATGGRGGTGGQGGRGGNGADGNDGGPGGPGGKGGEGGAGGLAGDVFVIGAEMRPIVNMVGGKGGVGGFGGIGGRYILILVTIY